MNEGREVSFNEIASKYLEFIDGCSTVLHYAASSRLQAQKIEEIESGISNVRQYKMWAVEAQNEAIANEFFHMQCVLNSLKSTLHMWIQVKNSDFRDAWISLIDAQEYIKVAQKVRDYQGLRVIDDILHKAEDIIFPSRSFYISSGHIETIGKCSIYGVDFSCCEHIEDNIYMGKLCRRLDREIKELNHVALVKNPHDKRCVYTRMTNDEGRMVDYFTGEACEEAINETGNMKLDCIILSFDHLIFLLVFSFLSI